MIPGIVVLEIMPGNDVVDDREHHDHADRIEDVGDAGHFSPTVLHLGQDGASRPKIGHRGHQRRNEGKYQQEMPELARK